ncbi:MAG TPA: alpha/beta hydrolase [Ramlibacter sp.]|jgi:pimeloyl-ACP methyl ester carboxylesterase|nr:alpha/beta hydrolase [Ramlibacter sp.]
MHFIVTLLLIVLVALALLALFTTLVAWRVDKAFRPPGEFTEVDGERLHYRTLGEGPPIVLVHGLGGETRNFDYLPLQELATRWRLVLVDRAGSGHSPRRDAHKAGIPAQARLVAGFIRAMDFQQPPLLVGHSLGGAIALAVALQEPQCIAGIALIAPLTHYPGGAPKPFGALEIRHPHARRFFAHTLAAPLAILTTPLALHALFGPDPAPRDFGVRGGGLRSLRPAAFVTSSTDMMAVEDQLPALQDHWGRIRLPVFLLHGEGDRVLDWREQAEGLRAKLPDAQVTVIPGGHMLPVTQAAATAAWLQECAQAVLRDL